MSRDEVDQAAKKSVSQVSTMLIESREDFALQPSALHEVYMDRRSMNFLRSAMPDIVSSSQVPIWTLSKEH